MTDGNLDALARHHARDDDVIGTDAGEACNRVPEPDGGECCDGVMIEDGGDVCCDKCGEWADG